MKIGTHAALAVWLLAHFSAPLPAQEAVDAGLGVKTYKLSKVPVGQLVLARSPEDAGPRLVVFDPKSRKTTRTLALFPKEAAIDQVALAPGRDRIAFCSTLNKGLTIADWNVFVLETATGQLNQITPRIATGKGLLKPIRTAHTGTIKGKVQWLDRELGRQRSDVTVGLAKLHGTGCVAQVQGDGSFVLRNVPVTRTLLYVWAGLPNLSTGAARNENPSYNWAGGMELVTVQAGKVVDVGLLTISPPKSDVVFGQATWRGAEILASNVGSTELLRCGYPKRSFSRKILNKKYALGSGLAASPDGKLFSFVYELSDSPQVCFYEAATGKMVSKVVLPESVRFSVSARGCWLKDNVHWVAPCKTVAGDEGDPFPNVPAFVRVNAKTKQAALLKRFDDWTGADIVDLTLNDESTAGYFVLHTTDEDSGRTRGDLYLWSSENDRTTRLTRVGDVASVSNRGR